MNTSQSNTLTPVVIIILAMAATVGVFAFSIWPADKELEPSAVTVRTNRNTVTTNVTNSNESTNRDESTNVGNDNANNAVQNDATKDWKTYTHPTLKYSVMHPQGWNVYTCLDVTSAWFGTQRVVCDSEGPTDDFGIVQQPAEFDLNTTIEMTKKEMTNPTQTTIQIAGTTGTRLTGSSPTALFGTSSYADYVFFQRDGRYFSVSYIVRGLDEKLKKEFEAFISSLAFSVQTTDATKDWKTYTNAKWGFSFKYPATLKVTREDDFTGGFLVTVADTKASAEGGTTRSYEIDVRVNPDGYSQYPYKTWTIEKLTGKGFKVVKEDAGTVANPNSSQNEVVAAESTALTGTKGYKLNFLNDSTVNKATWEAELKTLLSTFNFTK